MKQPKSDRVSFTYSVCDWKPYPLKGTTTVGGSLETSIKAGETYEKAMQRVTKQVVKAVERSRKRVNAAVALEAGVPGQAGDDE